MNLKSQKTFLISCALGASLLLASCTAPKPESPDATKSPAPVQSASPAPTQSASPSDTASDTEPSFAEWGSDRAKKIASGGMVAVTAAFDEGTEIAAENVDAEKVKLVDNISALRIVFDGFKDKLDEDTRVKYHADLQTLGMGVDRLAPLKGAELASHLNDSRVYAENLMGKLADIEESVKNGPSSSSDASK